MPYKKKTELWEEQLADLKDQTRSLVDVVLQIQQELEAIRKEKVEKKEEEEEDEEEDEEEEEEEDEEDDSEDFDRSFREGLQVRILGILDGFLEKKVP